ncbi:MAG: DUF1501 domain-containing protein [Planctomycetes bacterium]|nr:DUF1501 domain-containing protein [Planctomycetota bacterium]
MNKNTENSLRIGRRSFLGAGALGLAGMLTVPGMLEAAMKSGSKFSKRVRKSGGGAERCIILWMAGAMSQLDTFDPKTGGPNAGEFKPIATSADGVQISETLPNVAKVMDRLTIVRSIDSGEGNHSRGRTLLHTAYAPEPTAVHPGLGSMVSHELGEADFPLPNFVSIGGPATPAGFLGKAHAPFVVQDPGKPPANLVVYTSQGNPAVNQQRYNRRLGLMETLEGQFRENFGENATASHDALYETAVRMMRSDLTQAFEIGREPADVLAKYGDNNFGKGCLMARRLLEAGVKCVEVTLGGWDTHNDNFNRVKALTGQLDPAFATLVLELEAKGMLDSTLVVLMSEFGRTPRVNANAGRDHWSRGWSVVLGGGGIIAGEVYGSTSGDGMEIRDDPVTVPALFETMCELLMIDTNQEYRQGLRPQRLVPEGHKPIDDLID